MVNRPFSREPGLRETEFFECQGCGEMQQIAARSVAEARDKAMSQGKAYWARGLGYVCPECHWHDRNAARPEIDHHEKGAQLTCPECGELLWDGDGQPGEALAAFGHLESHREALLARERELASAGESHE